MKEVLEKYFYDLNSAVNKLASDDVIKLAEILSSARADKKTIYVMGNGGSASTASHFACDIGKGASFGKDKRFKIICLNDNIPTLMAYANDVSYEDIFVEQLKNFLETDDVVIAFSGSGNSKNILKAVEYANEKKAVTVGITGYDGGKLKKMSSFSVNANVNDMQISEDIHMILVHVLLKLLK